MENVYIDKDYIKQYEILKDQFLSLQEEKKKLEGKRDSLKARPEIRAGVEDEIREILYKAYIDGTWNEYKEIKRNDLLEKNMRKKEETYEQEYFQLMDEIANLTNNKQKNGD